MKTLKWIVIALLVSACSNETIQTNGIGVVSMNSNLSSEDPLENYISEYEAIYKLGSRGAQTAAPWSSLNPTELQYDLGALNNPYFGISKLKDLGFEEVLLNIPIVALSERKMPTDIASLTFNDPIVKERIHQMIEQLSPFLPSVTYLALGNEVDTYFNSHQSEWLAFVELINDARTYIKNKYPQLQIGVTTTFDGYSHVQKDFVITLNKEMDVVILTYYPTTSGFMVKSPETVQADVELMVDLSEGKPVVLQEAGYPSSSALGSSESLQDQFVQNIFNVWRKQGNQKIPFISFFKYRDWSPSFVQQFTGQSSGQPFYEFMSSLGLVRHDQSAKPAIETLKNELKK